MTDNTQQQPSSSSTAAAKRARPGSIHPGHEGRTIGHGVIVAYIAFAAAVSAFVVMELLAAWNGVAVIGLAFLTLFLGDIGVQRADMNGGTFGLAAGRSDEGGDDDTDDHSADGRA